MLIVQGSTMRFRHVFVLLILVCFAYFLLNWSFQEEYSIGVLDYFFESTELTKEETAWLKNHGAILYGADQNSPPLRYVDENSAQYQGVVVDYMQALSIEIETEIKYIPLVWEEALKSLESGRTDVCDMFPSKERSRLYDFSDSIYNLRGVILVHKDSAVQSIYDLKGIRVAVPAGDYAVEYLNSKLGKVEYRFSSDMRGAVQSLLRGEADVVVGDEPVISYYIRDMGMNGNFTILDNPMYELSNVLAVTKSNSELLPILNKGIRILKRKNTFEKIQQKWLGVSKPFSLTKPDETAVVWYVLGLCFVLFFLYLTYLWNSMLKDQVRKQTEVQRLQSQELLYRKNELQTTFDALDQLMLVVDDMGIISNANQAFCSFFGVNLKDAVNQSGKKYLDRMTAKAFMSITGDVFHTGESFHSEMQFEGHIWEVDFHPLGSQGGTVENVLIMLRDVTMIRISERKMHQTNKMAAIGQLAAGMAHEIRNPLGAIRFGLRTLKQQQEYDESGTETLFIMEEAIEKANNTIENLLNFSRLSDSQLRKFRLRSLFESVIRIHSKAVEKSSINYYLNCDPQLEIFFFDETLKIIISNLISNAIDAITANGSITIDVTLLEGWLLLVFSDDGTGISRDKIDLIFDPFFTTKPLGVGTGLGLYLVYTEIENLKGTIEVESVEGVGSCFTIRIPMINEPQNAQM